MRNFDLMAWLNHPDDSRGISVLSRRGEWETFSYRWTAKVSRMLASQLYARLASSGERVGILASSPYEFLVAFFAIQACGATAVPLPPPSRLQRRSTYIEYLRAVITDAVIGAFVVSSDLALLLTSIEECRHQPIVVVSDDDQKITSLARITGPSEIPYIQYSSGSTRFPVGARIGLNGLIANFEMLGDWLDVRRDDSIASWLPFHHDMGLVSILACIALQLDVRLMSPEQFVRDPLQWIACFGTYGCTLGTGPNLGYRLAARRAAGRTLDAWLGRWRAAIVGAERVDVGVLEHFIGVFAPYGFDPAAFRPAYGLAEATLAVSGTDSTTRAGAIKIHPNGAIFGKKVLVAGQRRLGDGSGVKEPEMWLSSAGRPLRGVEVEVCDESGNAVEDGTVGEVWVRSPSVALGYVQSVPDEVFMARGLRTGDAGFLFQGELYVIGRMANRIKIRGTWIHAETLEQRLVHRLGLPLGSLIVVPSLHPPADGITVLWEARGNPAQRRRMEQQLAAAAAGLADELDSIWVGVLRGGGIPRTTSGKPQRQKAWQLVMSGALRANVFRVDLGRVDTAYDQR